jgi:exodeoxyribonuclease VII small subunit
MYNKGMELLKYCNDKIDTVEKQMLQIDDNGELNEF